MTTQEFNNIKNGQKVSFRNFNDITRKEETIIGEVIGTWQECVLIGTDKGGYYANYMNVSIL